MKLSAIAALVVLGAISAPVSALTAVCREPETSRKFTTKHGSFAVTRRESKTSCPTVLTVHVGWDWVATVCKMVIGGGWQPMIAQHR